MLVFEPVDSAEGRERDFVADAANEESQDTLASLLCPLVRIVDVQGGHVLADQLRIENLWVCGQVPYAQFHEHVLEARFDAQGADHVLIDEPRRLNGDPQPLIVEDDVIVVLRVLDRTVSTGRTLRRFTSVSEVVKERDRFVFMLAWPRVLVANRWWRRSCAAAAYVEATFCPPFIHLQPKTINKNRNSVRFDGMLQYRSTGTGGCRSMFLCENRSMKGVYHRLISPSREPAKTHRCKSSCMVYIIGLIYQ